MNNTLENNKCFLKNNVDQSEITKNLHALPTPAILQKEASKPDAFDPLEAVLEEALDNERPELRFHRSKLLERTNLFQDYFSGTLSYAVKANNADCVLSTLHEAGLTHYDVASLVEMKQVHALNPKAILHYHNPIRSQVEIEAAFLLYNCRRFVVDSVPELEKLHRILSKLDDSAPKTVEIAVRLCMPKHEDSVQDFSKKFGANEVEAERTLMHAKILGYSLGMTFHVGSQCLEFNAYDAHIKACSIIAKRAQISLDFINVGGGFPATYFDTERQSIADNDANLRDYFKIIDLAIAEYFSPKDGQLPPKLECEPGRALVAPAFSLMTTVKAVRTKSHEIYLNDGIYGGLMEAYQFKELTPRYNFIGKASETSLPSWVEWTVYGPTCDPCDQLPIKLTLPAIIHEDEKIEFLGTGAYSLATATRFNGYGDLKLVECE